jgi:hypothetical protein
MAVACAAAALNPRGPIQILNSGLPAAAAAFGLTRMDNLISPRHARLPGGPLKPLERSVPWIVATVIVLTCFVLALGRGVRFS